MPSNEKQIRMMHIVNLMSIAYADGNISEDENNILINIAQQLDITEEEFNLCIDYWKKTDEDKIPVAIPENDDEQIEFLKHFAIVMMIDGQIEDKEKVHLAHITHQFGYDAEKTVPALIDSVYHEYFADDEEENDEEDPLFEDTDDETQIDLGKMNLESKHVNEAFDNLFLPALRNSEAYKYFLIIPNIDTRLFLLTQEQLEKAEEAADKGYLLALYLLGRYYQVVKPTEDWLEKAHHLLEKAAEGGISDAHWALAMLYLMGYEGPVIMSHYNELIDKAFENGSMMAFKQKLRDTLYGIHGQKANPKGVIKIIEDFLDSDEEYAIMHSDMYDILGEAYRKVGNKDKAHNCYENAQEHGFFESGAHRFENKVEGPDKDFYRETLALFLDFSCDDNDPNSFLAKAMEHVYHYDKEDCNQRDDLAKKIKEDLETAYRLGLGDAAYYIGLYLYNGTYGFEKNDQEAWQWFCKGQDIESGLAYMGMAQMIADGIHPSNLPENYMEYCQLCALRRGVMELLPSVVEAYHAGKLAPFAEEIESNYIALLSQSSDSAEIPTVFIVNPEGKAVIYKLEKEEWHKLPHLIGSKRLAPIRVDALDKIAKKAGINDHLVAWIDIDAPRKGMAENSIASAFYPGIIAGDIVFSLADNLYDPMTFFGIDEAKNVIKALKAELTDTVTDISSVSNEKPQHADYSKVNPTVNMGYTARIEPDGKAYIINSSLGVFALFEEDIYDPARLHKLYDTGKLLGINERLTIWTDNSAYRKQMVMYDKVSQNPIGKNNYPGTVVDNIYVALEDDNYRMTLFEDPELLKKACISLGVKAENIIVQ